MDRAMIVEHVGLPEVLMWVMAKTTILTAPVQTHPISSECMLEENVCV